MFEFYQKDSVEKSIRKGEGNKAKALHDKNIQESHGKMLAFNEAEALRVATEDNVMWKEEKLDILSKQRKQLLKIQEHVEDFEKFNESWFNDQISQLKQKYGKNVPNDLLARTKGIYNEANGLGVALKSNKIQQRASDLIQQDKLEVSAHIDNQEFGAAITKAEETKSRIRSLENEGIYTPKQAKAEIDSLTENNAGQLIAGALSHSDHVRMQEGFEAGEKTLKKYLGTLGPYLKKASPEIQDMVKKTENYFKAGNDDSDARFESLEAAATNNLVSKDGGPARGQNIAFKMRKILIGKKGDPHITPAQKAKIDIGIRALNGKIVLQKALGKAARGEEGYKELIDGVDMSELKKVLKMTDDVAFNAAATDYGTSRANYSWAKDPYGSRYQYLNDLNQVADIQDPFERAKDEYKKTGSISNGSHSQLSDILLDPNTPEDYKQKITKASFAGLLDKAIANKYDSKFNATTKGLALGNLDVFTNLSTRNIDDVELYINETPGARSAFSKVQGVILNKHKRQIQRLASKYGTEEGAIVSTMTLNMFGGMASGDSSGGGLSIDTINKYDDNNLEDHPQFRSGVESMLEGLKDKRQKFGAQTYKKDPNNPFERNKSLRHFSSGLFNDSDVPNIPDFLVRPFMKDKFSVLGKSKIREGIRKYTGLKDIDTIDNLRFRENSDATGIILQQEEADGYTRRDLFYDGEREPLFISYKHLNNLAGDKELKEEEYIDIILEGLKRGAD